MTLHTLLSPLLSSSTPCHTLLSNRSIIQCKGVDTIKFLQGITTNQMQQLQQQQQQQQISTLILNSKGKIMFDLLITRIDENSYFIEHDQQLSQSLYDLFKKHKLRNKIEFELLPNYKVYHSFVQHPLPSSSTVICNSDPRLPNTQFGNRCYTTTQTLQQSKEIEEDFYYLWRAYHGIAEGKEELFFEEIPALEANFEHLNSISWNKGCYVGQELTARSFHQGIIRKRILPFLQKDNTTPLFHNMKLSSSTDARLGRICSYRSKFQIGFALLRLKPNLFDNPINITAMGEGGNSSTVIQPIRPKWFTDECFPQENNIEE